MSSEDTRPLICIIDDDEDIRLILEHLLQESGYRTMLAKDPVMGGEIMREVKPDLILLDAKMPKMNGYEFCEMLQQDDDFTGIPIIFMTALESEQDKARAFKVGAAAFLNKPIKKDLLKETIIKYLEARNRWLNLVKAQEEPQAAAQAESAPQPEPAAQPESAEQPEAAPGLRPAADASGLAGFKKFVLHKSGLEGAKDIPKDASLTDIYASAEILGLSRDDIARMLAKYLDFEHIQKIAPESIKLGVLPPTFCTNHQIIAIEHEDVGTAFVITDPFTKETLSVLRQNFSSEGAVRFLIADPHLLTSLLKRREREVTAKNIRMGVDSIPIAEVGTYLLETAVEERASDVHIEPKSDHTVVRFRIDGDLHEMFSLKRQPGLQVVSRFKALADMDVAERRRPQDGVMNVILDDRSFTVRMATTSTPSGESLVMRLLQPWSKAKELRDLGMTQTQVEHMMGFAQRNQGLLLVAGPTGSGKTTTIYSLLQHIDTRKRSLITIEDPVEYRMTNANQQQVDERAGMTFEALLKSAVRQDPDILFLGEMRDPFSSKMAIDFASTGHLTISTLHTANATTAIFRLERVGINRGAMADSILGVIAQKLIKKLCPHCKKVRPTSMEEHDWFVPFTATPPKQVAHPVGCDKCRKTGYIGREGVYEIVKFYPEISEMIRHDRPISAIRDFAQRRGDYLIGQHAIEKVGDLVVAPKDIYANVLLEEGEYRRKGTAPASPYEKPLSFDAAPAAAKPEEEELIGKPREAQPPIKSCSILVVEDDEETRTLLERLLTHRGYTVETAEDGIEALILLSNNAFDLILSDIEMPNLNGLKLLEVIATKGITAPVVFLTAMVEPQDEMRGLALGAEDYIRKPVAKDILLMRVKKVLDRRSPNR